MRLGRSVKLMAAHVNPKNGEAAPLVAEDIAEIVAQVRAQHAALCLASARSTASCAAKGSLGLRSLSLGLRF